MNSAPICSVCGGRDRLRALAPALDESRQAICLRCDHVADRFLDAVEAAVIALGSVDRQERNVEIARALAWRDELLDRSEGEP